MDTISNDPNRFDEWPQFEAIQTVSGDEDNFEKSRKFGEMFAA
jgi:hypothetical protein